MQAIQSTPWQALVTQLNSSGYALIPGFLTNKECDALISMYSQEGLYRKVINMQRYRFGKGEYKYFAYPLPEMILTLRQQLYPPLAAIANEWMLKLNTASKYPPDHQSFILKCNEQGQHRPTPLILKYEASCFNSLHQDLYGNVDFPFQVILMLSSETDYKGGELVLTEQIPRAQSKATVLTPQQGEAVIITTNFRPVQGSRGYYRANMKHGVSEIKSGIRYTLGIVFHDAA